MARDFTIDFSIICFDECIVEKIDIDEYDVAVDMVITDKRVFI